MNLTDTPWIPIVKQSGHQEKVSLLTLFQDGEEIRDLAVNPPQRIALMRLLICITQAALDGPEDEEAWFHCRKHIALSSIDYLGRWQDSFNLYGDKPFLQVADLKWKKGNEGDAIKPLATLDLCSPFGGSAPSLFNEIDTELSPENIPLSLLTLQNFSTGGRVGQGFWNNIQYNKSTFAAPCIKSLHTFILGETIIDSIYLNLLSKTGEANGVNNLPNGKWGVPLWEKFPTSSKDKDAFINAATTYLGRLVPLSRLVSLIAKPRKCIVGPPPEFHKIIHLPDYREPSTTIVVNKKNESYYFKVSSQKHMWRELGAILAMGEEKTNQQGAIPLKTARRYAHLFTDKKVNIWVGGLETAKGKEAKLNDFLEWSFFLPLPMLNSSITLKIYESGVLLAHHGDIALTSAVEEYWRLLFVEQYRLNKNKRYAMSGAAAQNFRDQMHLKFSQEYWSNLDRQYSILINTAVDQKSLNDAWYPLILRSMKSAFNQACPHTTPRQIQAFARAEKKLRLKKAET